MKWILQENIFNEAAFDNLIDALKRLNLNYSIHKVIPFEGTLLPEPEPNENAICFGSYSMRHTAKRLNLYPGVFDLNDVTFKVQRKYWGEDMLNFDSIIVPFSDTKFLNKWPLDEGKFIRPIHDLKVFPGQVIGYNQFVTWQTNVCDLKLDYGNSLTAETLIQVASLKRILKEHRFWIVNGNIVTASTYKIGNKVIYKEVIDDWIYQYVYNKIRTYQPHSAFCIDIAETENGLKIVEIGTINSCGFYAADIQKLIIAMEETYDLSTVT